jgi:maltooligosyltrehalose trehalohydrolase
MQTFLASKLDLTERESHSQIYALHRDLLRLRREDPVIGARRRKRLDTAVLSETAFLLRWFDDEQGDRLLLVNLGDTLTLQPAPEPLLAPPRAAQWELSWSSEDAHYGGKGIVASCEAIFEGMHACSAALLCAGRQTC